MKGGETLGEIVKNSNGNSLLLFFVVIAVMLIISIPSIVVYLKYKANKAIERVKAESKAESTQFQNWTDREKNVLQVLDRNAESNKNVAQAITQLTTVLSVNNKACESCKDEQTVLWKETRQDISKLNDKLESLRTQLLEIMRMLKEKE